MRGHEKHPEPGMLITVFLAGGLGLVWLLLGFTLAMSGLLGTNGTGGSWNVPGPDLTPLGLLRLLLLFPIYATLTVINLLIYVGLQPGVGVAVVLALVFSVGLGALSGLLVWKVD